MNRFYLSIDQETTSNRAIVFALETGGLLPELKKSLPNFSRNLDGLSMMARKFGNLFVKMLKEQS